MNDININEHLNTDVWFDFQSFYDYIASHDRFNVFVEIGVWKGHSICYLGNKLRHRNDISIYAVDLWEETYKYEDNLELKTQKPFLYDIFIKNVENNNLLKKITPIKEYSWKASKKFKDSSVDFVFIDADHEYESVKQDITNWLPKLKCGGIIAGHDYFNPGGVKQAVNEIFASDQINFNGSCWYVNKQI